MSWAALYWTSVDEFNFSYIFCFWFKLTQFDREISAVIVVLAIQT